MRNKENRLVITFHSTTEAMEAEKRLKELGVPGRLIPIPRQLSAGCGLAWRIGVPEYGEHQTAIAGLGISFQQIVRLSL